MELNIFTIFVVIFNFNMRFSTTHWLLTLLIFINQAFSQTPKITQDYSQTPPRVKAIIADIQKKYVPDKRLAYFQIEIDSNKIVGKTNLAIAKKELLAKFKAEKFDYLDKVKVLPDVIKLEQKIYAVVNVSVANMRYAPKESAELVSQVLLGSKLNILDKEKGWYLIQSNDGYLGWIEGGTIVRLTADEFELYQKKTFLIIQKPYTFCFADFREDSPTISDLTWGNIVSLVDTVKHFYKIELPDYRIAYILKNEALSYQQWLLQQNSSPMVLVKNAYKMLGLPYLWGGTSWKGIDCSGFTRMVYLQSGIMLPRDASQQVKLGTNVLFDELKEGDLLFFGEKESPDKPEKVVHVGIWLGNNQFIHSSGMVRVSSFDKNAPNYDEFNVNRYLRAKRIDRKDITAPKFF